jgi:hypothetical protein
MLNLLLLQQHSTESAHPVCLAVFTWAQRYWKARSRRAQGGLYLGQQVRCRPTVRRYRGGPMKKQEYSHAIKDNNKEYAQTERNDISFQAHLMRRVEQDHQSTAFRQIKGPPYFSLA